MSILRVFGKFWNKLGVELENAKDDRLSDLPMT
jgi:hypothetical protein